MRCPGAAGTVSPRTTTQPPAQERAGSTKLPVNTAPAASTSSSPDAAPFSAACRSAPEATRTVRVVVGIETSIRELGSNAGAARSAVAVVTLVTLTFAVPAIPLTVARTVAAPTATPVIMPEEETVANVAPALIDQ